MNDALLAAAGTALMLLIPYTARMLKKWGHAQTNFQGRRVVQSMGLPILLWAEVMMALQMWMHPAARRILPLWMLVLAWFALLGLADDALGSASSKGVRGHVRALLHGEITTGMLKMTGGLAAAFLAGMQLHPHSAGPAFLAGMLIALCANMLNLLDLRPGRAGAIFLAAAIPCALFYSRAWPLWLVVVPTLPLWLLDRNALLMLGDCGSNLLGAALGLALAVCLPVNVQAAAAAALIVLHLVAEKRSFTAIIEKNRLLKTIDQWTGVREP